MKKFLTLVVAACMAFSASAISLAGGVFDHVGVNLGVGTTGISIEASTPITRFVQMRAGVSILPSISFNSDVDSYYYVNGVEHNATTSLKGDLKRVQGQIIFNVYPVPVVPFYVAAGAYFGGSDLVKVTGSCPELQGLAGQYPEGVIIGDYEVPVSADGRVSGGLKVNGFRPYLGIGWGRAVPSGLFNFSIDLGVQIHGKPKLYTDYGEINLGDYTDDNTFDKIMNKVKVYPTLTLRLGFRAF